METRADTDHMREALSLAERGWGHVSPNPLVGALVVADDGAVVGRGWYEGPRGQPHAEVRALAEAGDRAASATLYCTLEPCDHHASTPPCTRAVIDARVRRVVVGAEDPNPLVDGRGLARLRDAGIEVLDGVLAEEAHRLNAAFERHVRTGLPFVVWKTAASLDGKTAAADGSSRWITSAEARADAHRLRAWADAVIVGAGTVLADDPALTARSPAAPAAGSRSACSSMRPGESRRPRGRSTMPRRRWSRPPNARRRSGSGSGRAPAPRSLRSTAMRRAASRRRRSWRTSASATSRGRCSRGRHARVELRPRRCGRPHRAVRGAGPDRRRRGLRRARRGGVPPGR